MNDIQENDTLTSSGATVLYGGSGNDTFMLDATMITALQTNGLVNGVYARIDGGSGIDTIQVSSSLNLTTIANQGQSADGSHSRIASVEVIDLSAAGDQTLTLNLIDVLDMTGFNSFATTGRHQLLVKGNTGGAMCSIWPTASTPPAGRRVARWLTAVPPTMPRTTTPVWPRCM